MVKKIAINGFGRIGRTFLRILLLDKKAKEEINVVAINIGPGNPDLIAQLFKYDTILREFNGPVEYQNGFLYRMGKNLSFFMVIILFGVELSAQITATGR